ncbi:MAG TPA: futalosine hydrolase [Mycobacteriales bacterium]|nr:futalosine hydrolase [Mycobacteriales bacterium]
MSLTLVVTAVDAERDAVADGIGAPHQVTVGPYRQGRRCETAGADVLVIAGGVGPAAAAAAASYAVATHDVSHLVSMGIAGAFASANLAAGAVALASVIVAADLGAMTPERFLALDAMGLDGGATVASDDAMLAAARAGLARTELTVAVGPLLTLSTITGTTHRAAELMAQHGAVAEAMEGAGVAHVAALHHIPVLEVRTISNQVGMRDRESWDLLGALSSLTTAAGAILCPGWT